MKWFTILLLLPCWVVAQNYCSVCKDHTMCKYQASGPTCGFNKESGVSAAEIQQILSLHNYYRAKIAMGMENRGCPGPQPSAANMQELIWDDNLAAVAQNWADQCIFQHDTCRDDPRFHVGQNMYFSSGFSKVDWSRAISAWYEEVPRFDSQIVDSFQFQPTVGHYTQLAWGNTRFVGCGRVTYGGAYRVEGYQQMEYILSFSPRNQSVVDTEDKNRRRTDILPDVHDISSTLSDSEADFADEVVTQLYSTPTATQSPEENNSEQSNVENSTENNILTTTDIEKEQTITPSTSTQTEEENILAETTVENTIENSTENDALITTDIEKEQTITPSTNTQTEEENILTETTVENTTENFTENDILITTDIEKEQTITPTTNTQAEEENILGENTVKNSTEDIDQSTPEIKDILPIKDSSTKKKNPKFTIFIPGYWISNSQRDSNGQLAGSFQSVEFSEPGDLNKFIKETPSTGALKIASWNSKQGQWDFDSNRAPLNFPAENPARIQVNILTQKGWVRSTYDNLGRDQILVCNYGPAGNYLFQPIYIKGPPCSRCPTGSVCRNGLCA